MSITKETLEKISNQVDQALAKETPESLKKFLMENKDREYQPPTEGLVKGMQVLIDRFR